jgi:hypothetical protein
MGRRTLGVAWAIGSLLFFIAGLPACSDDQVAAKEETAAPEKKKEEGDGGPIEIPTPTIPGLCSLAGPKLDDFPLVPGGASTCGAYNVTKPEIDDAFYIARQARTHTLQSTTFVGAFQTLVTDVVFNG